ncbi:MAG: PA2779 family protein [Gammaproteobacteria bacterium]|nr:PA2779 family protein [Gammaproteobacteria bacterium]
MKFNCLRQSLLQVVSLAIICTGFAQVSHAGVIETSVLADQEDRATHIARVEVLLASAEVARQFEKLGVDQALVAQRIQTLSNTELLLLQEQMDQQVAGGDALAVIGTVFLVLLILELVGVTDIFKSI